MYICLTNSSFNSSNCINWVQTHLIFFLSLLSWMILCWSLLTCSSVASFWAGCTALRSWSLIIQSLQGTPLLFSEVKSRFLVYSFVGWILRKGSWERILGWKLFSLRILKPWLHCLLASSIMKSDAILRVDPLNGLVSLPTPHPPGTFRNFSLSLLFWNLIIMFCGVSIC